jgi:hypothetical protein
MKSALEPVAKLFTFTLDLESRAKLTESEAGVRVFKVFTALLVLILAAFAIIGLWRAPFILALVLALLAWLKHILVPIKWELLWFVAIGAMGAYAEALIIQEGGVWTYTNPQLFSIPIWLPAIWGLTAIALMTMYDAVTK